MENFRRLAESYFPTEVWQSFTDYKQEKYTKYCYVYYCCLELGIEVVAPDFISMSPGVLKIFFCSKCKAKFDSKQYRDKHEGDCSKSDKPQISYNCNECDYVAKDKLKLQEHQYSHMVTCEICHQIFAQKNLYTQHMKEQHSNKLTLKRKMSENNQQSPKRACLRSSVINLSDYSESEEEKDDQKSTKPSASMSDSSLILGILHKLALDVQTVVQQNDTFRHELPKLRKDIANLGKEMKQIKHMLLTSTQTSARSEKFEGTQATEDDADTVWSMLPVQNMEQLRTLEELLSHNKALRDNLTSKLKLLGGTRLEEVARLILCKVLVDEVAMKFSWLGRRKNAPFNSLQIADIITNAIKSSPVVPASTGYDQIILAIRNWLKHASGRFRYSMKRSNISEQNALRILYNADVTSEIDDSFHIAINNVNDTLDISENVIITGEDYDALTNDDFVNN